MRKQNFGKFLGSEGAKRAAEHEAIVKPYVVAGLGGGSAIKREDEERRKKRRKKR
jgi:hypothetical protein